VRAFRRSIGEAIRASADEELFLLLTKNGLVGAPGKLDGVG
jgi:hypothetical protein